MAMNRRETVARRLLKQAGVTGDFRSVVESLPPETLVQYDKLLKHEEPSVGPGMNSGIVVSYKSGEVVQNRPMQGNFSEEGIAVYEDGGAVERLITRDPRVEYPSALSLWPFGVLTEPDPAGSLLSEQRLVPVIPEPVRGVLEGIHYLDMVRRGQLDPKNATPEQSLAMLGAIPAGGLLFGRAPAGALGMNVFHGTPHKFAPEPGFPQGRPRLDKMGTGEGGQNFGKGFYTAESEQAGIFYRDNVPSRLLREADEDSLAYDVASYFGDDVAEHAKARADRSYLRDGYIDHVFEDGSFYRIGNNEIEGTPFAAPDSSLYKLDIPDADAAKLIDYDAPISQQPKVVQNAINRLGFMPDNPDRMAGGDVWYRMRQELGEDEATAAMREAGVPGLRYKDAGSRGTDSGDGTRNFVVWDQDVLDRTKVLQRNDENFLPTREARENLANIVDANTIGGRVIGDETASIDTLTGGASSSKRSQDAINKIAEQMRGPDGYIERLIVDQDGNVIEGAHRLEALRKLGITDVPITRIVDPTADVNLSAMKQAIKGAGPINSDHVNQITARVAEMLADVGGDPARVRSEYVFPQGFEKFFEAALQATSRKGVKNYEDGGAVEPRSAGFTLSSGRPVWQSGDDMYSEKTITAPYGDGWVNFPTVDVDGSILSEEEAIRLLDQIGPVDIVTGEPLPVFDRLAVAEQKASQRSVNLSMELKGAGEPRSADPEAEILAIYDLLDEENRKPERERDFERINELRSRLTELQAMSPPPVALEVSDDVYIRPQIDARGGISESNRRVPFGPDKTVQIRDRNMSGIARLGAEAGFPGFSGNDRLSGGVTGTYDRTKRLFPDEYKPFGYPSDARFGPRGFVPTGYDVRYSSGPNTFSGNVTPRQEGVSRDAPGGRSVLDLGYAYSTPEATYSLQATPFGRRVVTNQKTGDTEMDRSIMARYTTRF